MALEDSLTVNWFATLTGRKCPFAVSIASPWRMGFIILRSRKIWSETLKDKDFAFAATRGAEIVCDGTGCLDGFRGGIS